MAEIEQGIARTTARMRVSDVDMALANEIEEMLMDDKRQHLTMGVEVIEDHGPITIDLEANLVHAVTEVGSRNWIKEIHTRCGETLWDVNAEMVGRILLVTVLASRQKGTQAESCAVCLPTLRDRKWEMELRTR